MSTSSNKFNSKQLSNQLSARLVSTEDPKPLELDNYRKMQTAIEDAAKQTDRYGILELTLFASFINKDGCDKGLVDWLCDHDKLDLVQWTAEELTLTFENSDGVHILLVCIVGHFKGGFDLGKLDGTTKKPTSEKTTTGTNNGGAKADDSSLGSDTECSLFDEVESKQPDGSTIRQSKRSGVDYVFAHNHPNIFKSEKDRRKVTMDEATPVKATPGKTTPGKTTPGKASKTRLSDTFSPPGHDYPSGSDDSFEVDDDEVDGLATSHAKSGKKSKEVSDEDDSFECTQQEVSGIEDWY
jgi:hypothetical protein